MQEKGALAIKACYIEDNGDSSTLGGGGVYCTSGGALDTTADALNIPADPEELRINTHYAGFFWYFLLLFGKKIVE